MFILILKITFMNKQDFKILLFLKNSIYTTQRDLSAFTGYSLGNINNILKFLISEQYILSSFKITQKAEKLFAQNKPQNAIILAAGYGMRMVPINTETPKGLLQINNEPLIERQIKQLHEVGITDISIVVGFMKESYEYLIDKHNVNLIVNTEYSEKNNLHSLSLIADKIHNSYIIPCDIWCETNPFNKDELGSWYMVSDLIDDYSYIRINRKSELVKNKNKTSGNTMIGIAYVNAEDSKPFSQKLKELDTNPKYNNSFWEDASFIEDKMFFYAKCVNSESVAEINTYEQLRELDSKSKHLKSDAIDIISQALNTTNDKIENITVLKKGMTNRSFLFNYNNEKYIMRIPGEGTDLLINREHEAQVYNIIKDYNICDDLYYINPKNGYKITRFIENSRVCDPFDITDLQKCMKKLREFHNLNLQVDHTFDIFGQIDFYESLWNGSKSCFSDYSTTKENIFNLKPFVEKNRTSWCLTHIDAVPDNFLFSNNGHEEIQLIDWEYAGMQDPHVDIAMFCIYSMYDSRELIDQLIDCYFPEDCDDITRIKIYCYVAICGLLWSNWCEYKRQLGVEFGEYSLRQYRFAKDYYKIAKTEIEKLGLSL